MPDDDAHGNMNSSLSERDVRALEDENARLRAELDSVREDLLRLREHDRDLRTALEDSRRRLGEILGSLSWRLAKPLRVMGSLVRRIRSVRRKAGENHALLGRTTPVDPAFADLLGAMKHVPTPRCFRVLFLNGVPADSHSARYRVHNVREALVSCGIHAEVTTESELAAHTEALLGYDILVIFRACRTPNLDAIVKQCNAWSIPVVWDADDYIFEPEIVTPENVDALRGMQAAEAELYLRGVLGYRKALMCADYFTGPTDFLAERAAELGKKSYVIPNCLGQRQVELSAEARDWKESHRPHGRVRIAFMSGTSTHQKDFGTIAPVLARILKERPKVSLKIIGHLDLTEFPGFEEVADQVIRHEIVPWEDLPRTTADCDICVAPLDISSPFCQAKSDLKFIKGAAYGLAVVASATGPYRRHVEHGRTGFVCETADEWYKALLSLIDDENLRASITRNGTQEVLTNRAVEVCAKESTAVYRKIIHDFRSRQGVNDSSLVIRCVLPPVEPGSGGHEAVYGAAHQMGLRGHLVTLHFLKGEASGEANPLQAIRGQLGYDPLFQVIIGTEQIRSCDCLIATQSTTAGIVERFRNSCFLPAYFIQDFEPYFYPVGTEYFAAEQTYHYDFFCITLGQWLADLIRTTYGRRTRQVDFSIDHTLYHPGNERRDVCNSRKVAFFVRPDMPRRCFSLGMTALFHFHRMVPDAEIVLFGANDIPRPSLDFPFQSLGVLSKNQLGDLYRSSRVGLAFSTTNPSLVPLEMMACGLPVVDLDAMDSYMRHGSDYPAVLASPDPQTLAETLESLFTGGNDYAELSRRSMEFASRFPSREEALRQVAVIIEQEFGIESDA